MADNTEDLAAEILALLLPLGLVTEDPSAYAKLAEQPVVPWEDLHKLWNNSTTRFKKFQDPTSGRLENFWWHVWASDRRNLSGKTLSAMWEGIVNGPTVAPLRAPPRPIRVRHTKSMNEPESAESPTEDRDPERFTEEQAAALQERLLQLNLTPSSSRPPPSHPILKKPRGPSHSGPRPTARFADVPESEEDEEATRQSSDSQRTGSGSGSSGSGSGSGGRASPALENQTTKKQQQAQTSARSKSPAPKGTTNRAPAKKFVASKVTGKRRPVLPRRQSSQSSNGSAASDTSSKDGKSSTGTSNSHQAKQQQQQHQEFLASPHEAFFPSEGQGSLRLPTHNEEPVPNAKTLLGKLPAKGASPTKPTIVRTSPQPDQRNSGGRSAAPKRTSSPLIQGYTVDSSNAAASSGASEQPQRSAKSAGKQKEVYPSSGGGLEQPQPSAKSLGKQKEVVPSSGGQEQPQRSAKSLGKQREVVPPIISAARAANPLGIINTTSAPVAAAQPTQATSERADHGHPPRRNEQEREETPKTGTNTQQPPPSPKTDTPTREAPTMVRSRSNEAASKRMSTAEPVPSSLLKSSSVVAMNKLAVKGGFDFQTPRPQSQFSEDNVPPLGMLDPDIPKASVLDSRLSPTAPSPTPEFPMARSKSQLTLLLERDKERSERNSRTSSGSRNRGDDGGSKDTNRRGRGGRGGGSGSTARVN